jgi:hypothetical protein
MSELRKMTRMGGDLRKIAKLLQGKGRNGDTILAHINPDEAALLRDYGGSGTTNPDTGLLEFYSGEEYGDAGYGLPMPPDLPSDETISVSNQEIVPQLAGELAYGDAAYGLPMPPALPKREQFQPFSREAFMPGPTPVEPVSPGLSAKNIDLPLSQQARGAGAPSQETQEGFLSGLSKDDKLRLGLGLAGGVQTALTARKARQGAQEYANQIRALGQPYAQRGQAELSAAQRGELSPVGQQQLDAMRARAAQAQAQRGGVGAAQAQRAEEELRQRLNATREDFGLKLTGIGDQYTAKAIQEGIRADQEIASLYSNYFGNLMKMAAPTVIQATQPAKG